MQVTDKTAAYIRSGHTDGKPLVNKPPTITISRQCGAGSSAVASAVARWFATSHPKMPGLKVYDRNVVDVVVREHNLPESSKDAGGAEHGGGVTWVAPRRLDPGAAYHPDG